MMNAPYLKNSGFHLIYHFCQEMKERENRWFLDVGDLWILAGIFGTKTRALPSDPPPTTAIVHSLCTVTRRCYRF